jgi:hypothetical protein
MSLVIESVIDKLNHSQLEFLCRCGVEFEDIVGVEKLSNPGYKFIMKDGSIVNLPE